MRTRSATSRNRRWILTSPMNLPILRKRKKEEEKKTDFQNSKPFKTYKTLSRSLGAHCIVTYKYTYLHHMTYLYCILLCASSE